MDKAPYHAVLIFLGIFGTACCLPTFGEALPPAHHASIIRSVTVERPNLLVRGSNLSKVELWAVPSGTGISPDGYRLGTAKRHNSVGENEIWTFPIPSEPLLVTNIFAKAFDRHGRLIGRKDLPLTGVTDIYEALWDEQAK